MKHLKHTYHHQISKGKGFQRLAVFIFMCLTFCVSVVLFSNDEAESFPDNLEQESLESLRVTRQASAPFPRKIWQTSRDGPAGFNDEDRAALKSWTKMNQDWRYESITQHSAESYVRDRFPHKPEFIEVFTQLQDPILRADMIRYLVLLADGGLYSDLDTTSLKPIHDWIPTPFQDLTNVVVGIEYDRLQGDRWVDWSLDLQFATWTILAKPGHPLLELTVRKVIQRLKDLAYRQSKTISSIEVSFKEVLDTTGPALFTEAVFELLARQTGTNFTWLNVTHLKVPRLVEDILILPITGFGSGQSHSNSGVPDDGNALVEHLFRGSWKEDHPIDEDDEELDEAREHVPKSPADQYPKHKPNKTMGDTEQEDNKAKDESENAGDEDDMERKAGNGKGIGRGHNETEEESEDTIIDKKGKDEKDKTLERHMVDQSGERRGWARR